MTQTFFEKKIKPILLYVGTIGAALMSIGYIILMFVLVLGFNAQSNMTQSIVFAIVNAVVGFVIMQFLKIQGVDFAKNLPDNIEIMKQWSQKKKKDKKHHSMKFFWTKTVIGDVLGKALTVGITTAGIIYIVIEGSQDYNMLLLSVVNLLMFACFGLISLVKAYEFYNNEYIPFIQDSIIKRNNELQQKNVEVTDTIKPVDCDQRVTKYQEESTGEMQSTTIDEEQLQEINTECSH